MRASSVLAIAVLAAGVLGAASADAASHRNRYRVPARAPFVVLVPPQRSFLDPGPVVPVGSLSSYVLVSQYHYFQPWDQNNHFGEPPLPNYDWGGKPLIDGLSFGPLSGY